MPCCLTFRSRSLPKFTGNPADATDCWLGENMAFLPFSSVNFNRQNGPMNSVSSCKFTVPHMFSQKMLMEEPFPSYGVTLLIVRICFWWRSCLKNEFSMLRMSFSFYRSVKLNKCWRSIKRVLYSQFTTPIPNASFWKQCNKHTS